MQYLDILKFKEEIIKDMYKIIFISFINFNIIHYFYKIKNVTVIRVNKLFYP